VRRLYNPKGKKLPLPMVVELNRRLVMGYNRYKDDPRVNNLKKGVLAYNKRLLALNIRDHQVGYAKLSVPKVIFLLFYRLLKLAFLSVFVIPGLLLFSLVFVCGKVISIQKSREALAASTVKIQAKDVMATWKLLVALAVAPLSYAWWVIIFTYWCYTNRIQGYIPEWVSLKLFVLVQCIVFPTITYAALRFGEVGMDIAKSLPPLVYMLLPSSNNALVKLRQERADLVTQVHDLINTLGPELFPDFDSARIITDPFVHHEVTPPSSPGKDGTASPISPSSKNSANIGGGSSAAGHLPRNESFKDLGNTEFYSTRPTTPTKPKTRHGSLGGFSLKRFSTLDSKDSLDEVSKGIRAAMKERGRRRSSGAKEWELGNSETESEDEGKKNR